MNEYVTGDIFTAKPPKQTLKAWELFWDSVGILFQFQHMDVAYGDEEVTDWRLPWVAGVALLRTIGHVLAKVDAPKSPEHSREIERFWQRVKTDRSSSRVFWDFIEMRETIC